MSKPGQDNTGLFLVLFLLAGILALKIWNFFEPKVIRFYFDNRLVIAFILSVAAFYLMSVHIKKLKNLWKKRQFENKIAGDDKENSTFMGYDETGKKFSINLNYRRMHMQVVGTTNAGKTESVLVPMMIDDIEKGRGLILIDGKSDLSLLNKVYAYCVKHNRAHDFVLFSLTDYFKSQTYNPLVDGSVDQVAEKVINSFSIENEFFRTLQFDIFRNALYIFKEAKEYPTFLKIWQALSDPAKLKSLADVGGDVLLQEWATNFQNMNKDDRREQISGLLSNFGYFISGDVKSLFNVETPTIRLRDVIEQGKICYFQLPVLKSPMLGKSVAKMVLQDIQSQVSERHASGKEEHNFFGVYLDDFTEYLTKQFVSVLNKSRSANVGVAFAHQAIGDLETLGPEVKNQILTNANIKVFMRTNEPDSTEFYAKSIGTTQGLKTTSRKKEGAFGKTEITGDGSIREVEEFVVHPNTFKRELGRGQGIVVLTHEKGMKSYRVNFQMRKNLNPIAIPEVDRQPVEYLDVTSDTAKNKQSAHKSESALGQDDKGLLVKGGAPATNNLTESKKQTLEKAA